MPAKPEDHTVTWDGRPGESPAERAWPRRGALEVGEVLEDRYRIIGFIAAGGVGEVYEAHDDVLDQRVALKTIRRSRAADGEATERLKREIQLARQVTHPNACRLYELGQYPTSDGRKLLFLTMELLDGESLWEYCERKGRLSVEEAMPLVRQMADGLDAAHAAGVVHRDFKSSNVMLVPQKGGGLRAVITDFGLARSVDDLSDKRLTSHDMRVGTPAYMAPEQVQGLEASVTADIYALGVVLFEMLTGHLPFGGNALAGAYQRLTEKPSSPRLYVPDLEPRWERAILRCLEREPGKRFRSGRQVVLALEGVGVRPWRRGGVAIAVAAGFLVLLSAFGLWHWSGRVKGERPSGGDAMAAAVQRAAQSVRPSIAIVGFRDLGGSAEAAWLGPALAEMMRTEAAAGERLRVVSGEEVARVRLELGLDQPPAEPRMVEKVGQLLSCDLLVGGSYLVAGAGEGRQLRMDLVVRRSSDGQEVARVAERGSETALFELVENAGHSLRQALELDELTVGETEEKRRALPRGIAARYYAEGLDNLRRHEAQRARILLEKAVAEDPDHPLPRSALAAALGSLGYRKEAREEAARAAERVDVLPRRDAQWVEAQVLEQEGEHQAALSVYRGLWAYFPDEADYGIRLARLQTRVGDTEGALATIEELRNSGAVETSRLDLLSAQVARARSDYGRQRQLAARAAEVAESLGATLMAARAREIEAGALRDLGEPQSALEAYAQVVEIYRSANLEGPLARTLASSAIVHRHQGEIDEAARLSAEALDIAGRIGDVGTRRFALNTQAILLRQQGRLSEARSLHQLEVEANREAGIERSIAVSLTSLGVVERRLGLLAEAEGHFDESLEIAHRLKNGRSISINLNLLAEIDIRRGRLERAEARIEEALESNRSTRDPRGRAYYLTALGSVSSLRGDLDDARGKHEEALRIRTSIGESDNALRSRLALAALDLDAGDPARADAAARSIYAELPGHLVDALASALTLEARARLASGDAAGARDAVERARSAVASLEDREVVLRVELAAALVAGDAAGALGIADAAASLDLADLEMSARLASAGLRGDGEAWDNARTRAEALGFKVLPVRFPRSGAPRL
ncbi:MAG: serine/threonine-protein kinase [Acidobacteriota bacterium]